MTIVLKKGQCITMYWDGYVIATVYNFKNEDVKLTDEKNEYFHTIQMKDVTFYCRKYEVKNLTREE